MSIPRPVAPLAAGPIDAELSLVLAEAVDGERLYAWHREAMGPAVADLDGSDDAAQAVNFRRLTERVPSFFIQSAGHDVGYFQVLPRHRCLHVVNVAFGPGYRGAGRGTRLFTWLKIAARARSAGLHLKAYRSNPRALSFYQRLGFVISHQDTRHWWLDWPDRG